MLTANGTLTSIDRLRLGDDVMAFDSDGALHRASVRGRMTFLSEKHYEISLSNGSIVRNVSFPLAKIVLAYEIRYVSLAPIPSQSLRAFSAEPTRLQRVIV